MANKSISQLTSAAAVAETDLLATAIVDGGSATGYATRKHTVADVGAHIGTTKTFAGLNTTSKNLVGAVNEAAGTVVTGTLTAGSTSLTLQNAAITTDSTFDFYTDTFGVNPTAVSVSTGQIVLTFEAQAAAVGVKVVVR